MSNVYHVINLLSQFISDYKRRNLQKNDVNLRRRIELIQDFEMPTVSTKVGMTEDGNYIFVAGEITLLVCNILITI